MKPHPASAFADAVPVDGRGRRSNHTMILIRARATLLRMAATYFPASSDRESAHRLRAALSQYHSGRWRRDRTLAACPPQYADSYRMVFFAIFTMHDHVPGDRVVRAALAARNRF